MLSFPYLLKLLFTSPIIIFILEALVLYEQPYYNEGLLLTFDQY